MTSLELVLAGFAVGFAVGDLLSYFAMVVPARREHAEAHAAWCDREDQIREEMRLERRRYKMELMYWRGEAVNRGAPRTCPGWHERGTRIE